MQFAEYILTYYSSIVCVSAAKGQFFFQYKTDMTKLDRNLGGMKYYPLFASLCVLGTPPYMRLKKSLCNYLRQFYEVDRGQTKGLN